MIKNFIDGLSLVKDAIYEATFYGDYESAGFSLSRDLTEQEKERLEELGFWLAEHMKQGKLIKAIYYARW